MSVKKIFDILNPIPPVPTEYLNTAQSTKFMLDHSLKAGLGWAGIAAGVKLLSAYKDSLGQGKDTQRLRSYINARYPVVSIDPNVGDTEEENKERNLGVTPVQTMIEPDMMKAAGEGEERAGLWETATSQGIHPMHPIATALAMSIGIYGGAKGVDYFLKRRRSKQLDKNIAGSRNELDKLLYDEYNRTRGLSKTAGDPTKKWSEAGKKAYATLFSVLFIASLYSSKKFLDNKDPNRNRMKELQALARERAKMTDAPIMFESSKFPKDVSATKPKEREEQGPIGLPDTKNSSLFSLLQ